MSSVTLLSRASQKLGPDFEVVQLDVKQGDGALFKKDLSRIEMVDVGGEKNADPAAWILKASRFGIDHVDAMLFSHLDEDHVGAVKELLDLVPITCIETHASHWRSEKGLHLRSWLADHAPEIKQTDRGCILLSQVAWFRSNRSGSAGNELMGGIVFTPNKTQAYFALGDGDESQELAYEAYFSNEIKSHPYRIFKISHHGSRFSSEVGFLKRMAAAEWWISVGKKNPYHHPHPLTLAKLGRLSGDVYRTDEDGDIKRSFKE